MISNCWEGGREGGGGINCHSNVCGPSGRRQKEIEN
jgi:hypothetical protein